MAIRVPYISPVSTGVQPASLGTAGVSARANATEAAARGVEDAGKVVLGITAEQQAFKNAGKLADLQAQAKQAAMQYQNSLLTNKDPGSWAEGFQSAMQAHDASMQIETLPPDVRQKYELWSKDFTSSQALQISRNATVFGIEQAQLAKKNSVTRSMQMHDWDGAKKEINDDPFASPEEKERDVMTVDKQMAEVEVDTWIEADPIKAKEQIESSSFTDQPGFTEDLRDKAKLKVNRELQTLRSSENNVLEEKLKNGELTPDEISNARYISESDKKSLDSALRKSVEANTPPSSGESMSAWKIMEWLRQKREDPAVSNDQYLESYNDAKSAIRTFVPPKFQGELNKDLNNLAPSTGRDPLAPKTDRAFTETDLRGVASRTITRAYDRNLFGDISKSEEDKSKYNNPAVAEAAARKAESVRLEMFKRIKSNPSWTEKEVQENIDSMIGEEEAKKGASIGPSLMPGSGPAIRSAATSSMPPLPPKRTSQGSDDPLQIPAGTGAASPALFEDAPELTPEQEIYDLLNN